MGKLPTVDLSLVGDLLNNQRLTWFLIGNLIGLGGLLLVVFASDASRRSSPEPVIRHSSSSQSLPESGLVVKAPKTTRPEGQKPAANLSAVKAPSSASGLKTAVPQDDQKPAPEN